MPDLPAGLRAETAKLANVSPYIWLLEAQADDSEALRICAFDEAVTFEGVTWTPFPFLISTQTEESDGSLSSVTVSVSNVDLAVSGLVRESKIDGKRVRLLLVHRDHLSDPAEKREAVFRAGGMSYDEQAVNFSLVGLASLDIPFPGELYSRTRCRFLKRYGGRHCQFDTDRTYPTPGGYPSFDAASCDGTLDGPNGCRAHGAAEEAAGLTSRHPRRFGAQPGIPRGRVFDP